MHLEITSTLALNHSIGSLFPPAHSILTSHSVVIGAIQGQLRNAFSKIEKLNAKNGFNFAIAVGDLFDGESEEVQDLLNGSLVPAIPIYFTVGEKGFPQSVVDKLSKEEEVRHTSIL